MKAVDQLSKEELNEFRRADDSLWTVLEVERTQWEGHWRELSDVILPRRSRFLTTDVNDGRKMHSAIINPTATLAAKTMASGMQSGSTNQSRPWFKLSIAGYRDDEMAAADKRWLAEVENRMRDAMTRSNLYTQTPQTYLDLGVFGTNAFLIEEDDEDVFRCYQWPIGSYWCATDHRNRVCTVIREFSMTARQMAQKFGAENLSEGAQSHLKHGNNKDYWYTVRHVITENTSYQEGKIGWRGKKYRSMYYEQGIANTSKQTNIGSSGSANVDSLLRISGYEELPVMASRWEVNGEDVYGSSPGMDALGDVKGLQHYELMTAEGVEKTNRPPMTGPTSMRNKPSSLLPSSITYADATNANDGYRPVFQMNFPIDGTLTQISRHEDRIRKTFHANLFMMMAESDRRQITAREIEELSGEKMLALGPVVERMNDELLDPTIRRIYGIMLRKGLLPEPPEGIAGRPIKVEYISIMAQAQKTVGLAAVERYVGFVSSALAPIDPNALDNISVDATAAAYAEMVGIDPDAVPSEQEREEVREARARLASQQAAMQQAEQQAGIMKDLAAVEVGSDSPQTAAKELLGVEV